MNTRHLFYQPAVQLAAAFFLATAACQGPTTARDTGPGSNDTLLTAGVPPSEDTSCYLHVHGKDSIHLHLNTLRDSVNGTLHFNNYQIDGSQGTVHGRFSGDTLFVRYDFHAEGTHNITEEAFLKRGGTLIRGLGERAASEEVYRFTDRGTIDFSEGQVFQPVSCTKKE